MRKEPKAYWEVVKGTKLSQDFKDLIRKMLSFDGAKRPTIEQIR